MAALPMNIVRATAPVALLELPTPVAESQSGPAMEPTDAIMDREDDNNAWFLDRATCLENKARFGANTKGMFHTSNSSPSKNFHNSSSWLGYT